VRIRSLLAAAPVLLAVGSPAQAGEVHVAVATNFAPTCEAIGKDFTAASGHRVLISSGSSGKLAAQIETGAPFELFLSADAERPRHLEAQGLAVAGSRFPYAVGRLVLWSAKPDFVDPAGAVLAGDSFRHLAIANPELAPYGAAAREVLTRLGHWQRLEPRLVRGEDIGQTFQFVATGNAELGFVALAQLVGRDDGSRWPVPAELHAPIEQQAVLLATGAGDEAARAFLAFLRGEAARARIEQAGYGLPAR
jgi:molybdate transport system substrate-binding protein